MAAIFDWVDPTNKGLRFQRVLRGSKEKPGGSEGASFEVLEFLIQNDTKSHSARLEAEPRVVKYVQCGVMFRPR